MDSSIRPPKHIPKYSTQQSKYHWMDGMLPARWLACASSGSGKTVAIVNFLTNHFTTRGGDSCFDRIYLWSPTAFSDRNWDPVDELVRKRMRVPEDEPWRFEDWDPAELSRVLAKQKRVVAKQKLEFEAKKPPGGQLKSICVIIDDFAARKDVLHSDNNVVAQLFFHGRHSNVSCVVATQSIKSVARPIRLNCTGFLLWRVKNFTEYAVAEEEVSNLVDRHTFRAIYDAVTGTSRHDFLFLDLQADDRDTTFYKNLDHRVSFPDEDGEPDPGDAR